MRDSKIYTIMAAKAATGAGNAIFCRDFRHAVVTVNTASSANLTLKFVGSIAEVAPNFAAAQSVANPFDYVQAKDLEDASTVDGDTGFAPAGTDDQRMFEINVNGLEYLSAVITAYTAGNATVTVRLFND